MKKFCKKNSKVICFLIAVVLIYVICLFAFGNKNTTIVNKPYSNLLTKKVRLEDDFYDSINYEYLKTNNLKDDEMAWYYMLTESGKKIKSEKIEIIENILNKCNSYNENSNYKKICIYYDSYMNNKKNNTVKSELEYYFNLIVRHAFNNEISMSTFQTKVSFDYANTNSFVKNIENSIVNIGISQGYFQKADYKQIKKETEKQAKVLLILGIIVLLLNFKLYTTRLDLAFGALFILGIGLIIGAIYLHRSAKHYVLLTQFGEDEYAKWRGLYEFLNSMTLMNERTVIELPLWEKYLVYATAFGISEKVIKALEIRCPEIDLSTSEVLRNPYYRSTSFRSSSRSFRNATRSASHSSSSGGFRSGSYYGGGGRGGGGGGGGH